MTPAALLLVVALVVGVGVAAYVWRRYGLREGLATLGGVLALVATVPAMLRALRPPPERPLPPRHPDAPLPEAERERVAVREHEAHVEEMSKVKAIPNDVERRKELSRLAAAKWKRGES